MEEADADVRSLSDHVGTVWLKGEDGGGVAAPDVGDVLGEDSACDAQERCLSTEEDVEKHKGCRLAVKLADSVEDMSVFPEVRDQISHNKGSKIEEMHVDMDEDKRGYFPVESAESGRTLHVTCGETFCSKDVSYLCDTLNQVTKMKQHEQEGLTCSEVDQVGVPEVNETTQDLQLGCEGTLYVNEGSSDAIKHDSEQWLRGVDGRIFMADDYDELKQDDLMLEIEVQISRTPHEDSVPSISGSIDASLNGNKAGCADVFFSDSVVHHAANGGGWKGLRASFGEESQSMYSECMHGMVDKVTEESQCQERGFADEGGVLCDGVLVEPILNGLTLMHDAGDELETDIVLPNIDAEMSCPVDEASVPSIYKSPMDAQLGGKAALVCEMSESVSFVENFPDPSGDETRHCRMAISKCLPSPLCKDANMVNVKTSGPFAEIEVPLQQADQKSEPFEFPPEKNPTRSSYNQPCDDAVFCTDKESSDLHLGHQGSSGVELGSLDPLAQEVNTCNSVNGESCSVDFVEAGNDGGLQSQKSEPLIVFRRRNPRRAASSRNCNVEKHDQMNNGINSTHKSKKVGGSRSSVQRTMLVFPNKTTKGRSVINRPHKSTAWGTLQQLTDGFGKNCGPSTSNSHQTCPESWRSNKRPNAKLQPSIRKTRSSRYSKNKRPYFSDVAHSTGEFNMQHTFSVTADTTASSEGHIRNLPRLAPHELVKISDDAPITTQFMPMQTDMEQFDRCLESIAPEICPAYINGECAKSTSEPSLINTDVGFSPDSVLEVASVTCESNTSASHDVILHEGLSYPATLTGGNLHASVPSTSYFGKSHALSSTELEHQAKTVRGEENTRKEESSPPEAKLQSFEMSDAVTNNKKTRKLERQKKDRTKGKNLKNRNSTKISSVETSKLRAFYNDSSELLLCTGLPKSGSCFEAITSTQNVCVHGDDSMQGPFATEKEKWCESDNVETPRCKKKGVHGSMKGKARDPHMKGKGKRKNTADDTFIDSGPLNLSSHLATDLIASQTNEQNGASVPLPHLAAWVCCDDCEKWRCVPADLVDIIRETNRRWTCKDNRDKAFADCCIPQEKTNAEINAELELSDASADEADNEGSNSKVSETPSWTHVKENSFSHRSRRKQSIDEIMVCNCKPPQDGRMGCGGVGCLNRILNIECEKRTCPCGEKCSNQQFQKRKYANISWFRSGQKGYGLQLQEEVSEGQFLIEYVGEVLDITTYEARQRYYASKGQKHFYFMALNGGEVIDARTKGNLGRFINHSCSPNCRTEKWMVNGEVCIGIFAMRKIKKGEELTFDYNYVRVSGAAPQKCFCGTSKCRGYIGGEISGSHIIAQDDDAEAENFDLMTVDKDAEEMLENVSCSHGPNSDTFEHGTSIPREDSNDCPPATPESEHHHQSSAVLFNISEPENSLEASSSQDAEDVTRTPVHVSRTMETSLQQFPAYDTPSLDILQKNSNPTDVLRDSSVMSGSPHRSDPGSSLVSSFHANKKIKLKHHRNVKPSLSKVKPPPSPIDNEHTLGVEGRLNNLLDGDGGIRARKDAAKGYLKLLLVTVAGGDNAGGTSKSVRDISLILDALLKTKSNAVLLDIISKNGLQMLQNILKQNRNDFVRTPIIRKLLKVLEFLLLKKILTSEDINGGPRCVGMESFRDSMLSLIRHKNTQVQQNARNFRDKWITPNQDGPVSKSNSYTNSSSMKRKRKSRWDYQPESHYKMIGLKIQKVFSGYRELNVQTGLMNIKSQGNLGASIYHNYGPGKGSSPDCADDEVPPGFEPRQECKPLQVSLDGVVAPGFCQERYLPNLSISYGIPIDPVHKFGIPEVGGQYGKKWKVAPGVLFIPFPPLPPYPRGSP